MKKSTHGTWVDYSCLLLIFLWIALYGYPYFFESLTNNYREIETYSLDTAIQLNGIKTALGSTGFRVPFADYGHFYYNLTIAIAYLYSIVFPLTDHAIIFMFRSVSYAGGCATIATVYIFAKRYMGRVAAIFAAIAMGTSPLFVQYSLDIKPDACQLFLLVLSMYLLARSFDAPESTSKQNANGFLKSRFGYLLAASAAAGAAFGTKYQGIFLIPFLMIGAWTIPLNAIASRFFVIFERLFVVFGLLLGVGLAQLGLTHRENYLSFLLLPEAVWADAKLLFAIKAFRLACLLISPLCAASGIAYALGFQPAWLRTKYTKRVMVFIVTGLSFTVAFAATSPWLMWHLQFINELYLRSRLAGEGEWFGFHWLSLVFGYYNRNLNYIGYGTGLLSIAGCLLLLASSVRRDWRGAHRALLIAASFAGVFALVLITGVNYSMAHYALPMVPSLILLAAFSLSEIRSWFSRSLPNRAGVVGAAVLTGLLFAAQIWQGSAILLGYPSLFVALSPDNRQLGVWLERCAPRDAMILAAPYSYVPPDFQKFAMNEGFKSLTDTNPDIVITDSTRRADAGKDEKLLVDMPGYALSDLSRFYAVLFHSHSWRAGPTFGKLQAHARNGLVLPNQCF